MNVFVTSKCPIECAKYLDTKRVSKMTLESAQLLSAAMRKHGYEGDGVYKISHENHPSSIWARETRGNYEWLLAHFKALAEEYHTRRGHWHKSFVELYETLSEGAKLIPEGELTPFANCAANESKGVSYKHLEDTHMAYKLYLEDRWTTDVREPVWT